VTGTGLLIGLLATDDIAVSVIDDGAVAVDPTGAEAEKEERREATDDADDRENDTDRVEIDPVLIWTGGHRQIENGSDGEDHEAGDESTGHVIPPIYFHHPTVG
jgi:hypothetical protein